MYLVCVLVAFLLAFVATNIWCKKKIYSMELVVLSMDFFVIVYLIVAVPFIFIGNYSVCKNIIGTIITFLVLIMFACIKYRKVFLNKDKSYFKKIEFSDIILVCGVIFAFLFTLYSSESILSEGDMGAYFQQVLLMMKGNYDSRYHLVELFENEGAFEEAARQLVPQTGVFIEESLGIYELHGICTWCIYPALFGKIFGVYNCNKALAFLFALSYCNFFLFIEKKYNEIYKLVFFSILFLTSPLLLSIEIEMLSEISILFLFSFAIYLLSFDEEYDRKNHVVAGLVFGLIGFMHVMGLIYNIICMLVILGETYFSREKKKLFYANLFQGIGIGVAIWYQNHVSPFYAAVQFNRITSFLSFLTGWKILLFIDICIVVLVMVNYALLKIQSKMEFVEKTKKLFPLFCFCIILIVLIAQIHFGYKLAFTNEVVVPEDAGNTWSQREGYVGKGAIALEYLGIINLLRATGWVGFLIFCCIPFIKKTWSKLEAGIFIYIISILVILIYQVSDVPRNYYASRYFAPILVPGIVLIVVIACNKKRICILGTIIALLINMQFLPALFTGGTRYGQYDMMRYACSKIERNGVVMADRDDVIISRFISVLRIYNNNLCYDIREAEKVIDYYGDDLPIYIISSGAVIEDYLEDVEIARELEYAYSVQGFLGNNDNARYSKKNYAQERELFVYEVEVN